MPLSTTNLTLHVDASDTDKLFTTANGGGSGVHTGTPGDGDAVEVWDDEGDGISDFCLWRWMGGGTDPLFRSGTPLMLDSCLDFDGSADAYRASLQDVSGAKAASNFVGDAAKTIIVAFYAESITTTGSNPYDCHTLVGDTNGFFGLHLRDVSGTGKIVAYSYHSAIQEKVINCTAGASHVAVMRHDGSNLYISLDNGTEESVSAGTTDNLTFGLTVGISSGSSSYFNGRIGEIAIYNAAITGSALSDSISYFMNKWVTAGGIAKGTTTNNVLRHIFGVR